MSVGIPPEVLRLLASNPYVDRLNDPMGSAEKRSPICGSRVIVDVDVDAEGRVAALGMKVNACAFGQAAATVLAKTAVGKSARDLASARDEFGQWLAGEGDMPDWPEIETFDPERLNSVRKASVQLAFQAAAEAAEQAADARVGIATDAGTSR